MTVEQLTYTDLPRGMGFNPASSGYQIKASSAGLSAEAREYLSIIYMHYGDAVYRYAPRTATERETAWRTQTNNLDVVPDDVLKEYPIIWSYDRLPENLFALTQVRYSGLTHDRRPGNFFAHTLVFHPDSLDQYDSNPLSFSRLGSFPPADSDDKAELSQLENLGAPRSLQANYQILMQDPFGKHLEAMISALCVATLESRPVIICLADWRQAPPLVETLLNLLPPAARCRTTVCTYESDRSWLVPVKGVRPTGLAAAHHLLVLCGSEGRVFNLRPDEYQSRYAIFNFVEGQFSNIDKPHPFAAFAAKCVINGEIDSLIQYHELVEQLGFGQDANAWDKLVPFTKLRTGQRLEMDKLVESAQALVDLAVQPEQIQIVINLLMPYIELLAQSDNHVGITNLSTALVKLADRLPIEDGQTPTQGFVSQMQGLAGRALVSGYTRTATALLQACGQKRDHLLLELLNQVTSQPLVPTSADEQKALVDLLCDGLRLAETMPDAVPLFDQLLIAVFQTAQISGHLPDLWRKIGIEFIQPRLSGAWDTNEQALAQTLVTHAPAVACPEANAWLNLRRLDAMKLQGESLFVLLTETASSTSRCGEAEKLTSRLLQLTQEQVLDKEDLAMILGRMAEAASVNTPPGEKLFEAYRETIELLRPNRRIAIRRKLVEFEAVQVICREVFMETLPWDVMESPIKFQHWRNEILVSRPKVLDALRQQVADLLIQPEQQERVMPLVEELLPKQGNKFTPEAGLQDLCGAWVLSLPLRPMPPDQSIFFTLEDGYLAPEAAVRLRILKFMSKVQQRAEMSDWSTTKFPYDDPVWNHDIQSLHSNEKLQLLTWYVNIINASGLTTLEETQALVQTLDAVDQKSAIAEIVGQLIKGSDTITNVLIMTSFIQYALNRERPNQIEFWGHVTRDILKRCDRIARQLLEAHIAYRFAQSGDEQTLRLHRLCQTAGLSLPKPAASSKPGTPPLSKETGKPTVISPKVDREDGIDELAALAKNAWQKLRGTPKNAGTSPEEQKTSRARHRKKK